MSRIIKYIEQAEKLVGLEMPEPALTEIRKALEGVCNDVIKRENFTVEGKNPQLEQKMQEIFCRVKAKELSIPKSLSIDMVHIQRIGNHASHDQGEEIPISIGSASAALIQVKELAKWYFSNYGLNEPAPKKKNKEAPRKLTKSFEFIEILSRENMALSEQVGDLFEELSKLQLKLNSGTSKLGSIIVNSPQTVEFYDAEQTLIHKRLFNFGVFYANGVFKNFSCEGVLGKEYLNELSKIIPNSKVYEHPTTEFRNCVVNSEGEHLKIKDILQVKDAWLKLIGRFKTKI
jgi:hypothetical protein